ncbi:MAG: stage III sporulation protein AB, partial [Oscillospiraceae bacterium]
MLKIIGALLVTVMTTSIGIFLSKSLNERVKKLALIRQALEEISIQIRFKALTVFELLDELTKNPAFGELSFLKIAESSPHNIPFSETWRNSLNDWKENSLKKEDIDLITDIGTNLGCTDIEGQLSTLELQKTKIEFLHKTALEEYQKKSKLYKSLGLLL